MNDKKISLTDIAILGATMGIAIPSPKPKRGRLRERAAPLPGGFCRGCGGRVVPREDTPACDMCTCPKGDW